MHTIESKNDWPLSIGIYKLYFSNSLKDKCYIGSTSRGFRDRWLRHLSALRKNKHVSKKLQNAFNKYGEEFLIFDIIEHLDNPNLLIEREQYHIDSVNSYTWGYNAAPKAGSQLGFRHTDETKRKISKTQASKLQEKFKGVYDLYLEGKNLKEISHISELNYHTVSKILRINNIKIRSKGYYTKKKIYQYSKTDGVLVGEWDSLHEFENNTKISGRHARQILKGAMATIKGYYLSYNLHDPTDVLTLLKNRRKHKKNIKRVTPINKPDNKLKNIDQYDADGIFIKRWKSSKDIVEFYNMKNSTPIIRVIRGVRKKFKNCIWKMENYNPRKSWNLK